jgi:hypothetical protein
MNALDVAGITFAPGKYSQTPIPKSSPLMGETYEPFTQSRIVAAASITLAATPVLNQLTRPPF